VVLGRFSAACSSALSAEPPLDSKNLSNAKSTSPKSPQPPCLLLANTTANTATTATATATSNHSIGGVGVGAAAEVELGVGVVVAEGVVVVVA